MSISAKTLNFARLKGLEESILELSNLRDENTYF